MMWPILCRVSYTSLRCVDRAAPAWLTIRRVFSDRRIWLHIGISMFVNWIIA